MLEQLNCHHQITYCKGNLSIEYPPPFEYLVWDCNRANVEGIEKSIESAIWDVMFNNKNVLKQVFIFNETLMNIFSNFTPNKRGTFDDTLLHWMIDFIKSKIKWKNELDYIFTKNGYKCNDFLQLQEATILVCQVIAKREEDYHKIPLKLNNPKTSAKACWSILKHFIMVKEFQLILHSW